MHTVNRYKSKTGSGTVRNWRKVDWDFRKCVAGESSCPSLIWLHCESSTLKHSGLRAVLAVLRWLIMVRTSVLGRPSSICPLLWLYQLFPWLVEDIAVINPMYCITLCETFYGFKFNFFIVPFIVHTRQIWKWDTVRQCNIKQHDTISTHCRGTNTSVSQDLYKVTVLWCFVFQIKSVSGCYWIIILCLDSLY